MSDRYIYYLIIQIVPQDSAVLNIDNEIATPMNSNHSSICKFPDASNQNYRLVEYAVEVLVAHGLTGKRR